MIEYYGRDGKAMLREEAYAAMADMDYKRVAQTQIGPYWVSTVWLGLDHSFTQDGPPIIFETMVFAVDRDDPTIETLGPEMDCDRYATEEQALAGHETMCLMIRATYVDVEASEEVNDERTT